MAEYVSLLNTGIAYPVPHKYMEATGRVRRIHVPLSGSITFHDGKTETQLVPGNIYILPSAERTALKIIEGRPYLHLFMDFRASPPPKRKTVLCIDLKEDKALNSIVESAIELITKYKNKPIPGHISTNRDLAMFEHIEHILKVILSHAAIFYDLQPARNEKLHEALMFISENYHLPLRNEDIAAAVGIDTRTLGRLFDKYLGTSPHQHLTQYRVEESLKELRDGKSVSEVAEICGFQSDNTFREAFKRVVGCAPSSICKLSD